MSVEKFVVFVVRLCLDLMSVCVCLMSVVY